MDPFWKINKDYTELYSRFGDSPKSVMIPKDNQALRYESISKHIPKNKKMSYLDYGSGLGHQKLYFDKAGFDELQYVGVEVNASFLEHSKANVIGAEFMSYKDFHSSEETFDMSGVVGTFNIMYEIEQQQWEFVVKEVTDLWNKTKKTMFLNFMSTVVDFQQEGAYHQELGELYSFIAKSMSRKVMIDSTYLPYEYTVIVCREENCVHAS